MIRRALLRSALFFLTAGVPSYVSYSCLYGLGLLTYGISVPFAVVFAVSNRAPTTAGEVRTRVPNICNHRTFQLFCLGYPLAPCLCLLICSELGTDQIFDYEEQQTCFDCLDVREVFEGQKR